MARLSLGVAFLRGAVFRRCFLGHGGGGEGRRLQFAQGRSLGLCDLLEQREGHFSLRLNNWLVVEVPRCQAPPDFRLSLGRRGPHLEEVSTFRPKKGDQQVEHGLEDRLGAGVLARQVAFSLLVSFVRKEKPGKGESVIKDASILTRGWLR